MVQRMLLTRIRSRIMPNKASSNKTVRCRSLIITRQHQLLRVVLVPITLHTRLLMKMHRKMLVLLQVINQCKMHWRLWTMRKRWLIIKRHYRPTTLLYWMRKRSMSKRILIQSTTILRKFKATLRNWRQSRMTIQTIQLLRDCWPMLRSVWRMRKRRSHKPKRLLKV